MHNINGSAVWGTGRSLAAIGAELVAVDARGWMLLGVSPEQAVERAARRLRAQVDAVCASWAVAS